MGCRRQGVGDGGSGVRFRVQGSGLSVEGMEFRVQGVGVGLLLQGVGCKV